MKHFNLSAWAVSHPALILFLVVALGAAGFFSYEKLGRAEDPFFTVKVVNVSAIWPGATAADARRMNAKQLVFFMAGIISSILDFLRAAGPLRPLAGIGESRFPFAAIEC